MPEASCTTCTPPPRQPRGRRAGNPNARATADFDINDGFVSRFCASTDQPDLMLELLQRDELPEFGMAGDPGCIFYVQPAGSSWERGMSAPLKTGKKALVAAPRMAFAATHAKDTGLREGQNVMHWCRETMDADGVRLVCVNPIHLVPA